MPNEPLTIEQKRELLKKMMAEKKAKAAEAPTVATTLKKEENGIDPSFYDVAKFPEIAAHHQQFEQLGQLNIENPYFRVNENIVTNRTRIQGRDMVSFSSYNFLGMSGDERVSQASKDAIDKYGTSVSASRVATGEKPLHKELEQEIAQMLGVEDAVVMVGGHSTNVTTIGHLMRPQDLIVFDELSHNSILQGAELSGARRMPFPHEDFAALDKILTENRSQYQRVLITIEGVYSMDGDIANLPEFIKLRNKHKCLLMVDEAHSMGVIGKNSGGIRDHFGVDGEEVDLWMSTFSKSFASCGGYIAGKKSVIDYLKYTAPGFLYSVGLPASNAAAALAAMRIFQKENWRSEKLRENAHFFVQKAKEKGLDTGISSGTAVVPIIVRNSAHALVLGHRLFEDDINVQPILAPAVADSESRLRFFITCDHTEDEMTKVIERTAFHLKNIREEIK
ncbi:MAG: aminotransferase class I/II-fold pyridoxal phosphate-dependent enzyme [Flavobacteriales bacterium]|nr:aminotransferase class I/II-fold pyridoxal phosphate-dependent enzyme [Flavobacteriales bacterium]